MNRIPQGYEEIEMPEQIHYFAGGVYAKQVYLKNKNTYIRSHKHKFDHLSILASGKVKVVVEGAEKEYTAPCGIDIKAGKEHEIYTLTDGVTWYCIHAIPEECKEDQEHIDEVLVERKSD